MCLPSLAAVLLCIFSCVPGWQPTTLCPVCKFVWRIISTELKSCYSIHNIGVGPSPVGPVLARPFLFWRFNEIQIVRTLISTGHFKKSLPTLLHNHTLRTNYSNQDFAFSIDRQVCLLYLVLLTSQQQYLPCRHQLKCTHLGITQLSPPLPPPVPTSQSHPPTSSIHPPPILPLNLLPTNSRCVCVLCVCVCVCVCVCSGGFRNLERGVQPLEREAQPKIWGCHAHSGHVNVRTEYLEATLA